MEHTDDSRREDKEYGAVLRALVQQENDLTNHRTTWLLVTQGVLFAAVSAPINSQLAPTLIIGLFGIVAAGSFGYVLDNSAKSRGHLKDLWRQRLEARQYGTDEFPPLDGGFPGVNPRPQVQPWYLIPKLAMFVWLALILYRTVS